VQLSHSGKNDDEDTYPLGIRYWVQIDKSKVPHIEVYECMGKITYPEGYFFKALKTRGIILKFYQDLLDQTDFKPFLLNLEKMRKSYGRI
jgi:hypothetical protein